MLSELNRLSIDADGRYATATELQFLKDYLQTVDQRISTYEKVRDVTDDIAHEVDAKVRSTMPDFFKDATQDYLDRCLRDRKKILRHAAAAMLIDDLDILRQGVLCWVRTIVNSVGYSQSSRLSHETLPKAMAEHLSPDELKLLRPAMELSKSILTDG